MLGLMSALLDAARGIPNACEPRANLLTGGQPGRGDLVALAEAGVRVILDIRAPTEWRLVDEPAQARALGFTYYNIPVGDGPLDDRLLDEILAVLRRHQDEPVFFHCRSGNRVGCALLPHLILDQELPEPDAVALAQRVGLRSREYLAWGLDYARRHRPG